MGSFAPRVASVSLCLALAIHRTMVEFSGVPHGATESYVRGDLRRIVMAPPLWLASARLLLRYGSLSAS